jgi:hypothetical protein
VPVLRLVAESLGESTCEAIEKGGARNLESIHLTHLREEEEVQVGGHYLPSAGAYKSPCKPFHKNLAWCWCSLEPPW